MSDSTQLASTCIELYNLLNLPNVNGKSVLLLLSKVDMPSLFTRATFQQLSQV